MTSWSSRIDKHHNRITITIKRYTHNALSITRRRALVPKFFSRSRPEPRFVSFQRALKALSIHVCERKDFASLRILNNRRYQALSVKFNLTEVHLTSNPRSRK